MARFEETITSLAGCYLPQRVYFGGFLGGILEFLSGVLTEREIIV